MANVLPEKLKTQLAEFAGILRANEPLAPLTCLKIGGPAEALAEPRDRAELAALVGRCAAQGIGLHILGGGGNILIREEGVKGVVVRLSAPAFTEVSIQGTRARAGCGASLAALLRQSTRAGLAGLETLAGIPGTVGGALKRNTSDRAVEIGQFVRRIDVIDAAGQPVSRDKEDLRFAYGACNLDDPVLVAAEFELDHDHPDAIVKRMRKSWIQRKAKQPFSFQAAGRIFRNPAGLSAAALIEQAGLGEAKVGGAQVSERDANFIVAAPGTSGRDVLRLIDMIRTKVQERFHLELELEISVW